MKSRSQVRDGRQDDVRFCHKAGGLRIFGATEKMCPKARNILSAFDPKRTSLDGRLTFRGIGQQSLRVVLLRSLVVGHLWMDRLRAVSTE